MIIKTFKQVEKLLASHIPKTSSTIFPGQLGLNRAKDFLHLLGDPQEKLKIIHVAGTSGKGSTCYLISRLLEGHGFKVGLHQSPHLTDVTERFQINNQNIFQKKFVFYLNKITPFVKKIKNITYFEILVGLAFYIFADMKVDYAVIETGLGGMYDGTNIVRRADKLSILTKIGLDHTNILGNTIEKIALQKAMIINKNSQAISISQDLKAEKVIKKVTKEKQANISFIDINNNYKLNLVGDYQMENASLALAAANYLGKRDKFILDKKIVRKVFETAHFPGRFDVKKIMGKTVIFDGAHNPQKMEAFISSLVKKYPAKKFNFLLAFKKGKAHQEMIKIIISLVRTREIIITSFFTKNQDIINVSEDPAVIVGVDLRVDPELDIKIIPDLKKAWEEILKEDRQVVVTGSLYLVGEVFRLIKNNKTLKLT